MVNMLSHIWARRRALRYSIDVEKNFAQWEESCVPSYVHRNFLAAFVSWQRLFAAVRLADQVNGRYRRVLDFGSSVGELSHILKPGAEYNFIELDDTSAEYLMKNNHNARRTTLDNATSRSYDIIFAIDSLEHNEDYENLLIKLERLLAPKGSLILSGPTENALYRIGRRIAGFTGEYHHTTILDIEQAASKHMALLAKRTIPFSIPLFHITAWNARQS